MNHAEKLIKIYQEAQKRLIDLIAYKEARGNVTWYQETLLRQVRTVLSELNAYSDRWAQDAITESYYAGVDEALTGLKRLGVSVAGAESFAALHTASVEILVANTSGMLRSATSFVGRQIEGVIRQAGIEAIAMKQATGATVREAARMVKDNLRKHGIKAIRDRAGRTISLDAYASTVARSTTREATNTGTLNQLTGEGYDLVKMSSHATTCPVCAVLQGRVYSISGTTPGYPQLNRAFTGHANIHPNCVVGETQVSGSPAFAAVSRHYEGKMFVINTTGGKELTVTPNHPILTDKGWVVPRLLNVGDKIGHYLGRQSVLGNVPNNEQIPPTIENVTRTLEQSGKVPPTSMEVSTEDFHGDGFGSDIAVVYPNSLLWDGLDSCIVEPSVQDYLFRTGVAPLALDSQGSPHFLRFGYDAPTNGIMSSGSVSFPLFRSHAGVTDSDGFVPVGSNGETVLGQYLPHSGLRDAMEIRNVFLRHPASVLFDHQSGIDNEPLWSCPHHDALFLQNARDGLGVDLIDPGDLIDSLTGEIEFDDITGIREIDFSGQVYNLHTKGNWYAANGIITHNCRHVVFPYIRDLADDPDGDQRFSNRSFDVDPRSKAEIERYNSDQAEKRQLRADRNQFDRYRLALGDDAPKTFAAFRRIKGADGPRWQELQTDYRDAVT